jgi:signal transduction histidine kinase
MMFRDANATGATPGRFPLLRLLWGATMPGALWWMVPLLGFLAFIGFDGWRSHASLADVASHLASLFGLVVMCLSLTTQFALRRRRAAVAGLLRAGDTNQLGEQNGSLVEPGETELTQPVLVGIASAFFGLVCGLMVITLLSGPRSAEVRVSYWSNWVLAAIFWTQAIMLSTGSARTLYTWGQQRAAAALTAQADVDRARMAALQAQMNPHFLFNALNTVAALLGTDGSRAKATVQSLSGMLKHTLDRSAEPLTTVHDELQFVRDYLAIEHERFGSRMDVTYDVDPATDVLAVPTMSLQPLVENAIKHAVTTSIEGGRIRISVSRPDEHRLRLSVEDDGPGFGPEAKDGTFLRNVRERLRTLYGDSGTLDVATSPSGARVTMTIPQQLDSSREIMPFMPSW